MPPENVDVNLHPTKEEVAILHLPAICDAICACLRTHLLANPVKCALRPAHPPDLDR